MAVPSRKSKKKIEFASTPEMQQKYLGLMLADREFLKEVSGYLQPELFNSSVHGCLFEILSDFHKVSPDAEVTEAVVLEGIARTFPPEEQSFAVDAYKEISADPLPDREFVRSCIRPFVSARVMEDALRLSVDLYEKGRYSEIVELISKAGAFGRSGVESPKTFSAKDLSKMEFKEPQWLVPGILPEGVSLLVGRPKMGKSYLILETAIALSNGGFALGNEGLRCPEKGVLYVSLEDIDRRLQTRIRELAGAEGFSENLHLATSWPKLDQGGLEQLETWLDENPSVEVVVIDTWMRIRGRASKHANAYESDVLLMEPLKTMADRRGISVILVHHSRKASADDPIDEISGSTGLSGSVDGIILLRRDKGGNPSLYVRGRDVEEEEFALERSETGGWTLEGRLEDRLTPEQQQIIDLLKEYKTIRLVEIAARLGKSKTAVSNILSRLVRKGLVVSTRYGGYELKTAHPYLSIVK